MTRTRNTARKAQRTEDDPIDDHPDQVNADIAEPHAVYYDGEQRTGAIHNVPYQLALTWLRHGWASILWWK